MARPFLLALLPSLALVLAGCAGSSPPRMDEDHDLDGIPDAVEVSPRSIRVLTRDGPETRTVTSDPRVFDTDGDGLSDGEEFVLGSDPRSLDSDGDGLVDGADLTLPPDSSDFKRLKEAGTLEASPGVFLGEKSVCPELGGTRPHEFSSDRPLPDKLGDGDELRGWTLRVPGGGVGPLVRGDPCRADPDDDGLLDDEERLAGSDPHKADTDGDGEPDGSDADPVVDLHLRLTGLSFTPSGNRTFSVRLLVFVGEADANVTLAPDAVLLVDVPDRSRSRTSHEVRAEFRLERDDGRDAHVFRDPRGEIFTLDVLQGTIAELPGMRGRFSVTGPDGTLRFDWERRE